MNKRWRRISVSSSTHWRRDCGHQQARVGRVGGHHGRDPFCHPLSGERAPPPPSSLYQPAEANEGRRVNSATRTGDGFNLLICSDAAN